MGKGRKGFQISKQAQAQLDVLNSYSEVEEVPGKSCISQPWVV